MIAIDKKVDQLFTKSTLTQWHMLCKIRNDLSIVNHALSLRRCEFGHMIAALILGLRPANIGWVQT